MLSWLLLLFNRKNFTWQSHCIYSAEWFIWKPLILFSTLCNIKFRCENVRKIYLWYILPAPCYTKYAVGPRSSFCDVTKGAITPPRLETAQSAFCVLQHILESMLFSFNFVKHFGGWISIMKNSNWVSRDRRTLLTHVQNRCFPASRVRKPVITQPQRCSRPSKSILFFSSFFFTFLSLAPGRCVVINSCRPTLEFITLIGAYCLRDVDTSRYFLY